MLHANNKGTDQRSQVGRAFVIHYLLSTQNIWLNQWVRKYLQFYAKIFCLSKPMLGMVRNPENRFSRIKALVIRTRNNLYFLCYFHFLRVFGDQSSFP